MVAAQANLPRTRFDDLSWILALALGGAVGVVIPALTGVREAWDHASYFAVALPGLTLFAGLAGWMAPSRAWFVAPALAVGGFVAMVLTAPGSWNLWPLSIAIQLTLHAPALLFALAGRALRRRRAARHAR